MGWSLLPILVLVVGGVAGDGGVVGSGTLGLIGSENLAPWTTGLLNLTPVALGSVASSPESQFPLVLAAKRTRRPDVLRNFKLYEGGWNVTNRHYWASVGFTGAAGFVLSFLWFISFGLALGVHYCCKWGIDTKWKDSPSSCWIRLALLLIFTCAASTGCILLSVGQNEFHGEVLNTLNFVLNQTDYTVQILRNVTCFLSLARTINVDQIILPGDVQSEIDKLNLDLDNAANTISDKMAENSGKIRQVFYEVRCALIVIAATMLLLAIVGFLFSILQHKNVIYIFIVSGWLLVAVTFVLGGVFVILNSAMSDTCEAMDEWVNKPNAETALSNILPCVDEKTTNTTLHQSKEVTRQLVNVVNTVIGTIANSDNIPPDKTSWYNQSGTLMPFLCSPYDSKLDDRHCGSQEVSLTNASLVWLNYTCSVSVSGLCVSTGRVTPDIYKQLVAVVNASYALDHYTPLLLSLQDCNFVRDTFDAITANYCPRLEHDLVVVNVGLGMISVGVLLCLILWILYAKRPQKKVVLADLSVAKDSNGSIGGIENHGSHTWKKRVVA